MRVMIRTFLWLAAVLATAVQGQAAVLYENGFETDVSDWSATRVASGTNGVTSATGSFHAETLPGTFSRWGGYNYGAGTGVPTAFQEYRTSVDIFLDVDGGLANNSRFDFSSAISNSAGNYLRDFIFNAGFYNDGTGPGAGTDRFVISASNNSQPGSAFAKNPARDPIAISSSGWYTFSHHFYDVAGVLTVDMSIVDTAATVLNTWTLSNPVDLITGVGGNRYGWFNFNELNPLAFDNAELQTVDGPSEVPEPSSLALLCIGGLGLGARYRRRHPKVDA